MFAAQTRAVVRSLGAEGDLIANKNVNQRIQMLSLVKVREKPLWPVIRYSIIDQTLLDLLEEADACTEYTEEVLMEEFKNLRCRRGGGGAEARADVLDVGLADLSLAAAVDVVDGVSPVSLKKKTVDVKKLEKSCSDKRVKQKMVDMLRVKEKEKLMFVHQTVHNTGPVTFYGRAEKDVSVSAALKTLFKLKVSACEKKALSFTVPKDSTFAYGLREISTEDGTLGFPPKTWKVTQNNPDRWLDISGDGEGEDSGDTLRQVQREIQMKEAALRPLAGLPESSRRELLTSLSELLQDGDALTLLEQTMDQYSRGGYDRPQSQAVCSFMDLLQASSASRSQVDAVYLLVNAMDNLPDDAPALLTTCPDALRLLDQLVDDLKEDGQSRLPEPLPPPLQEEGELRWAAALLCSTNHTLRELSDLWDGAEPPPGVLLELLCLVIRGLSLMLPPPA